MSTARTLAARPALWSRRAALALMIAGLSVLSGCGLFGGGARTEPLAPLPEPNGTVQVRIAWSVPVGAGDVGFAPTVVGNSVWAAAADGTVVRVDASSGQVFWRTNVDARLDSGVGSDGETAVVVSSEGLVVALDGSGARKWSTRLGSAPTSVPAVGSGLALVRGSDDRVVAFDLDDGRVRWDYRRGGTPLALKQSARIVLGAGTAYVGLGAGRMVALSLVNGAPRWDAAVAIPSGTTDIERLTDVVGTPQLDGREICAVSYQGRIGCFAASDGNPLWVRPFSSVTGLALDARFVFATDDQSRVHAFTRSGQPAWRQEQLERRGLSAPASIAGVVAMGDREGLVHLLGRGDGAVAARIGTDGSAILAQPVLAQNRLLVQTRAGGLYAIALD